MKCSNRTGISSVALLCGFPLFEPRYLKPAAQSVYFFSIPAAICELRLREYVQVLIDNTQSNRRYLRGLLCEPDSSSADPRVCGHPRGQVSKKQFVEVHSTSASSHLMSPKLNCIVTLIKIRLPACF